MGITLDKLAADAPELLSLAKTASLLLEKKNFTGQTAKVALVADFSECEASARGRAVNGETAV